MGQGPSLAREPTHLLRGAGTTEHQGLQAQCKGPRFVLEGDSPPAMDTGYGSWVWVQPRFRPSIRPHHHH